MDDTKKAFFEHLMELRKTVMWIFIVLVVAFVVVFSLFCDRLLDFITVPLEAHGLDLITLKLSEAWVTKMKISFIAAFIVSFPFTVWFVWRFLSPALYPKEKRIVASVFFVSIFLFATGVVFAYLAVFSLTVTFFVGVTEGSATPMLSMSSYVGFLISFLIPFGFVFLLPMVTYLLTKFGIISYEGLKKSRRYVILAVFVLAAIITPPDVVSQIFLAVPMLLLFEVSLVLCRRVKVLDERKKQAEELAENEGNFPDTVEAEAEIEVEAEVVESAKADAADSDGTSEGNSSEPSKNSQ